MFEVIAISCDEFYYEMTLGALLKVFIFYYNVFHSEKPKDIMLKVIAFTYYDFYYKIT